MKYSVRVQDEVCAMMTRQDYMEGRCSHRDYYGEIVQAAHIQYPTLLLCQPIAARGCG